MDDLILRAVALEAISTEGGCGMCASRVLDIPAVDAVPVVHGHWIEDRTEILCAACAVRDIRRRLCSCQMST